MHRLGLSISLVVSIAMLTGALVIVSATTAVAAYPGHNGLIVYADAVKGHDAYGSLTSEIFVSQVDGSEPARLTFDGGYPASAPGASDYAITASWEPAWSPNGQRIAFAHLGLNEVYSIEIMNGDGSERHTVTTDFAIIHGLTWSPDGRRLAFAGYGRFAPWSSGVWIINTDGSGATLVLEEPMSSAGGLSVFGDMAWSPLGDRIAFPARDPQTSHRNLYVMDTDGTDIQIVNTECTWVHDSDWSPDGQRLVVECDQGLVVARVDGQDRQPLPDVYATEHSPAWSPDGSSIVFASYSGSAEELWHYNLTADNTTLLGSFTGTSIDWQPLVRFTDIVGNVFRADAEWLAEEGITKGCNPPDNTRYCPNAYVTRGQMAAFLVRAFGYTDTGPQDLFTDDDNSIFETDINRLGTAGITKGCNPPDNTRYCPNANVTRGQMAAFLHRAIIQRLNVGTSFLPATEVETPYSLELLASGGTLPYSWSLTGGTLPDGIALYPAGVIAGTPTTEGSSEIEITVSDDRGATAKASMTMHVLDKAAIAYIDRVRISPSQSRGSICLVDPDFGPTVCLTDNSTHEHDMAWSPDHKHIVFSSYRYSNELGQYSTDLYVMNADGTGITALTSDESHDGDPVFSPDGTRVAFTRGDGFGEDIYVVDADGSNLVQLTDDPAFDRSPDWSPSGEQIAFASSREALYYGFDIYLMNSDGSNQHALTEHPDQDLNPAWSPNGSLIAFDTIREQDCNAIYIIDADGSNPRYVACGIQPSFSIDGRQIAYSTWWNTPPGDGIINSDLYIVNTDGSNPSCLVCDEDAEADNPAWS